MQTTLFKVSGMTCGSCVARVTNALRAIDGVGSVSVSLAGGEATVQFDHQRASAEQLQEVVQKAGYGTGTAQVAKPKSKGCCCSH